MCGVQGAAKKDLSQKVKIVGKCELEIDSTAIDLQKTSTQQTPFTLLTIGRLPEAYCPQKQIVHNTCRISSFLCRA